MAFTCTVIGHREVAKHTMYVLQGTLDGRPWESARRLVELRAVHDRVVALLGRARYERVFAGASFASRGGMPGTTKKLDGWCVIS